MEDVLIRLASFGTIGLYGTVMFNRGTFKQRAILSISFTVLFTWATL